ncbi:hypothetical protein RUM44_012365 [Polyplax serrata]|uniref:UNC-45/Cro1/She4 central domain-containing protein n=1 Tax=Polyplax serrata TaxID=468196 RepID=A0ABR1BB35_POLSC
MTAPSENLEMADRLKEEGNENFKQGNYRAALKLYTKAIECTPGETDEKCIYYKNRAAANLKLGKFEQAVKDTDKALNISPRDPKALFRRCQALECLDRFEEAYRDARAVLENEPSNKAIQPVLERLHNIVQKRYHENTLTINKVNKMKEIAFDIEQDREKRETAFNNLLILAREKTGADIIWKENLTSKLTNIIKVEKNEAIVLTVIRIITELCKSDLSRLKKLLQELGVPWFIDILNSDKEERVNSAQYCLQAILNTLSGLDNKPDSKPNGELCDQNRTEIDTLLTCLLFSTTSRTISALARDAVLELITRNVHYSAINWAERLVEIKGIQRIVEVAGELQEFKYESSMDITSNTRNIVAVCLSRIYDNMYYDKARQKFVACVEEFIKEKLLNPDMESKVRAIAAITTLLIGPLDVGNTIIAKEGIMEMILVMAGTEDVLQQKVACECIIAASSKKDKVTTIVNQGAPILKKLYNSKDDGIKVRALVGLCKLGASGGSDASIRPFAEGATKKLAEACRKFLVKPDTDRELRRWAAEGLSYLTLDAEVKEKLIEDKTAIHALVELAKTGEQNVVYGVVTTLVNLVNAYEQQEIMPEMIELAKFAKHHIPQEHEFDDPDFVTKRIDILTKEGVTTALVALAKTESDNSKELISRVFNAICSQQDLRGLVVQQGGAKVLLPMALNGTTNGKKQASQALARIGITINPEVAFPGQRILEVIRPLLNLLHPDCSALENFEALMALCNLASVSSNVRKRILSENGLHKVESYMFEEHLLLRRAATQVVTNLIMEEDVIEKYEGENDKTKYLFLLCFEEDIETVEAASGALAMLTSVSKKCCEKLFSVSNWLEVFQYLLSNPNTGIQHRALVIVMNIFKHDKEMATKLIETNVMDILMALTKVGDGKITDLANEALKMAEDLKLIAKVTDNSTDAINSNTVEDDPEMPELE